MENPEEQLRLLKRASHHIRLQLGEKNWHFGLAVKRWERTTKIKKDLPESEQKPLDGKIRECYNFTKILFPCTDIPEISQNSPTFTWDCDDILDRYRKNALGISYFHNDESDIDLDGIEQRVKTLENPSEIQQENLKLLVSMLHDVSPKVNDKDVPRLYDISLKALDLAPDEALKLQALLGLTESYFSLEDEKEGGRSANTLAAYSKTLDWSPALSLAMGSVLKERVRKWPMSSQIDGYNTVIELYKNVPDSELNGEKITLYLDRGILHLLEYMRSNDIESGQKSAKDIGRAMTLFHTDLPHPDLGAGLYAKEISKLADSVVAKRFPEINIDTRMDIVDQVENMVLSFYIHTKR